MNKINNKMNNPKFDTKANSKANSKTNIKTNNISKKNVNEKTNKTINVKEKKIIDILKENSRLTIKDIAIKTKIKPSTVYQTINRLKSKGIIDKFTIKLNDSKIGKNFIVYMLVLTANYIPKTFFDDDSISEAYGITGEYDMLLKLKFKDVNEFNNFIIDFRKNKNVVKTHTLVATTKIKE